MVAEGEPDPATKEALRYRHALLDGYQELKSRPLNTRTAEVVCSRIKCTATREVIYTPRSTRTGSALS
jgi:hypothetical protein